MCPVCPYLSPYRASKAGRAGDGTIIFNIRMDYNEN